jgi:hypothetical protein
MIVLTKNKIQIKRKKTEKTQTTLNHQGKMTL